MYISPSQYNQWGFSQPITVQDVKPWANERAGLVSPDQTAVLIHQASSHHWLVPARDIAGIAIAAGHWCWECILDDSQRIIRMKWRFKKLITIISHSLNVWRLYIKFSTVLLKCGWYAALVGWSALWQQLCCGVWGVDSTVQAAQSLSPVTAYHWPASHLNTATPS